MEEMIGIRQPMYHDVGIEILCPTRHRRGIDEFITLTLDDEPRTGRTRDIGKIPTAYRWRNGQEPTRIQQGMSTKCDPSTEGEAGQP